MVEIEQTVFKHKTVYMILGNKKIDKCLAVKIGSSILENVNVTKFLGVYVNNQLSWSEHINKVQNIVAKCTG